jgi:hypothetical protein
LTTKILWRELASWQVEGEPDPRMVQIERISSVRDDGSHEYVRVWFRNYEGNVVVESYVNLTLTAFDSLRYLMAHTLSRPDLFPDIKLTRERPERYEEAARIAQEAQDGEVTEDPEP